MTPTRLLALLVALVAVLIATLLVDVAVRRQSPAMVAPATPATHEAFGTEDVLIEFRAHGLPAETPPVRRTLYRFIQGAPQAGLGWAEFSIDPRQDDNGLVVACATPLACDTAWRTLSAAGSLRLLAHKNVVLAFYRGNDAAQRYESVLLAMR